MDRRPWRRRRRRKRIYIAPLLKYLTLKALELAVRLDLGRRADIQLLNADAVTVDDGDATATLVARLTP